MAKNPLLLKIGTGIVRGLPLLKSIKDLVKPSLKPGLAEVDGKPVETNVMSHKPTTVELIAEITTVVLILAFVFGKITMADLQALVALF